MRYLFLLALLLLVPLSARAERVVEVQNIRIEQTGNAGRDEAVAEATRQAAAQVWKQLGHDSGLPELSPAHLQEIASYVDVAGEVVQPNYYAANFNIGIRVDALTGGSAPSAESASASSEPVPAENAPTPDLPQWVLIVPGREINDVVSLWGTDEPWIQAWNRVPPARISTAVASGDGEDQKILKADLIQNFDPTLNDALRQLARKYNAPAVALVLLNSQHPQPAAGEEIQVEVTYIETGSADGLSAQGSIRVPIANSATPYAPALSESSKLIESLASGQSSDVPASTPGALSATLPGTDTHTSGDAARFSNSYAATGGPDDGAHKLWVRIPLATPMDLGNYRRKIESIPGARFQITALNRMYVEGNIIYSGDQAALMHELAARGLAQQ